MNKEDFKELVKAVYNNACNKGFHDEERDIRVSMQLISDEVAELHDAHRHGKLFEQCDKPITNFTCFEEETADIVIRIMDNIGEYKVDVDDAFEVWENETEFCSNRVELFNISIFCYKLNQLLTSQYYDLGNTAGIIISMIETLSIKHGYSIWDSIERKMAYNAIRPRLHGKKF